MAEGKVCVGFANPYVALYGYGAGTVTYSNGRRLARGVEVSINPEVADDNNFYADDVVAESDEGIFTGGTMELTVDGLHQTAEQLIMGLPAAEEVSYGASKAVKMLKYGAAINIPYVGVGYITEYVSGGVHTWVPTIIRKARFQTPSSDHKTREEETNWQTQKLKANLARDDSASHDWKWIGEDQATKEEADAILRALLNVMEVAA